MIGHKMMTVLSVCLVVWAVSLVIAVVEPSFISIETYVFFKWLAVTMAFIILFVGIAMGALAANIGAVI